MILEGQFALPVSFTSYQEWGFHLSMYIFNTFEILGSVIMCSLYRQ